MRVQTAQITGKVELAAFHKCGRRRQTSQGAKKHTWHIKFKFYFFINQYKSMNLLSHLGSSWCGWAV